MVVKILASNPTMKHTLDYNNRKVDKGVASVIGLHNIDSSTAKDIEKTFALYERRNIRSENVSFQLAINPDPSKPEEKLTDTEAVKYALALLSELGYKNQPIVIYKHEDIDRTHYHVVSIRVNENGKKIRDFREEYKLQALMKKYAKKYHYSVSEKTEKKVSKSIIHENKPEQQNNKDFNYTLGNVAQQYRDIFNEALKWKFTTFTQFQTVMKALSIKVDLNEGKEFKLILQGVDKQTGRGVTHRINENDLGIDAYKQMMTRINECKEKENLSSEERKQLSRDKFRISKTIEICLKYSLSENHLYKMLAKKGIYCTLSRGAQDQIFGATFTDTKTKRTFKCSELNSDLSVQKFKEADDNLTGQWHAMERKDFNKLADLAALSSMDENHSEEFSRVEKEDIYNDMESTAMSILETFLNSNIGSNTGKNRKDIYSIEDDILKRKRKKHA